MASGCSPGFQTGGCRCKCGHDLVCAPAHVILAHQTLHIVNVDRKLRDPILVVEVREHEVDDADDGDGQADLQGGREQAW